MENNIGIADDSYGLSQNFGINSNPRNHYSVKENSNYSKRSKSELSRANNSSAGNVSLPEIINSVVEDALPFKGLENHYKPISKEGFSGANDTNQMRKTNENFYSSMKSKQIDNSLIAPMLIKENSLQYPNSNNRTEIIDDEDEFDRPIMNPPPAK